MGKKSAVIALAATISFLCCAARSFPFSPVDSLKGLEGVEVLVEEIRPELEDFHITVIQIQGDVEAQLRHAGIRVLSQRENARIHSLRQPYLYVRIHSYKPPSRRDVLVFNVELALKQKVVLRGQPEDKCFFAPTWFKSSVGVLTWKSTSEVRNTINELMAKFIKAYLAAHR